MFEVLFLVGIFVLVAGLYLLNLHSREIRDEQNIRIDSLKAEVRFLLKKHRRDTEMLDWADKAGHYDARCESLRDELRAEMEKDNAKTTC